MNDRRPIFFTSDWHVGHENVLKYDERPFRSLDHMHEVLINNFNSIVPEDAITYFIGDMGLCKNDILRKVIEKLNGTRVLILGNHDNGANAMYGVGFDVVLHGATLWIAKRKVTMSHCPLKGVWREDTSDMRGASNNENWHGEHKQHCFTAVDEGQMHLHGHIHSPNHGKSQKILGRQMDVGVVANGYKPVSISTVESWITKYGR